MDFKNLKKEKSKRKKVQKEEEGREWQTEEK